GTVTRAGGRGPRSRPRHRQRIFQDHPRPPDRRQLRREPSVMCRILRRRQRQPLRPDAVRDRCRRVACVADWTGHIGETGDDPRTTLTCASALKENAMDSYLMFLNCPAYMDNNGAARCGLPAEVHYRYTMNATDGPLESAKISCPCGHHFNG